MLMLMHLDLIISKYNFSIRFFTWFFVFIITRLIGTGPVGDGKGMALFIPAGYLTVDPNKYDVAGEIVKQVLTYKQSRFGGDVGTTQPANSPVRIALGI